MAKSRTDSSSVNGPVGPEAEAPSVFHGHHFIEVRKPPSCNRAKPGNQTSVKITRRSPVCYVQVKNNNTLNSCHSQT